MSSSESHSSAEEDEEENENAEFIVNIENPDALVRFMSSFIFIFKRKSAIKLVIKIIGKVIYLYILFLIIASTLLFFLL